MMKRIWALSFLLLLLVGWLVVFVAGCTRVGGRQQSNPTTTPVAPLVETLPSISELIGTPAATFPPVPTLDPQAVALGREVYAEHCAVCHGANLEGHPDWKEPNEDGSFRPPPHDETGHTWHHPDGLLIETIIGGGGRLPAELAGLSNMPAFGDVLTDDEVTAVLTYIKSSWPADIRQLQWEATVQMDNQYEPD